MKKLGFVKNIGVVLSVIVFLIATKNTILAADIKENKAQEVADKKADVLVRTYGITSVQYALIENGEIEVSGQKGVYSKKENTVLSAEHMYGIASVSKMYTAAAVMKLVDMGQLDLDKPVTTYMPEFKMADERYKSITPRMLLNHSSGIMSTEFENALLLGKSDTSVHDQFLEILREDRLKATPGAYSVYSNDGFILAERLVEKVSGMDFTTFLHTYFIEPLGLKHTKTPQDVLEEERIAKATLPNYKEELPIETLNMIGAGGIYSTGEELCKFATVFMEDNPNILSKESLKAMESKEYAKGLWAFDMHNSFNYGLGWDSVELYPFDEYEIKALTKGGDMYTYHASLVVLPEYNMAAAVTSSGGNSLYNQMMATQMLLARLQERGIIAEIKPEKSFVPPVAAPMPEELMQHSGMYGNYNSLMEVEINKEGILFLDKRIQDVPQVKCVYTEEGVFVTPDGSTKLNCVKEKNGQTYLWIEEYITLPDIGQLVLTQYSAQKLEPHFVSEEVEVAWEKRNEKIYYLVNENYASELYLLGINVPIMLKKDLPGYVGGVKIVDENDAKAVIEIPMVGGRDLVDITFYEEDGLEYLKMRSAIYMHEEGVIPFNAEANKVIQLNDKGYTKFYTIPKSEENKKMTVTMPDEGNVIVYNEQGVCMYNAYLSEEKSVTLPKNGMIAFVGEPKAVFKVRLNPILTLF